MSGEIFSILAPVLITVAIGFTWSRSGNPYDTALITALVSYFGTPCLIFYSLSSLTIHSDQLIRLAISALAANGLFIILGSLFLWLTGWPQRAYLQTLSFPNVGNIGLPLCYLAFGEDGLALGITFFAVYAVFQLTVGAAFVSGSIALRSLVRMPIIPATLLAVFFLGSGIGVPLWLNNTTQLIGDLTIPLMLFTLGVSLATLKVSKLLIPLILSLFRIFVGFAVGLVLQQAFKLSGPAAGVVILQCSMPAAVFCYLFAQQHNRRPADVAGTVILSTLLSFALLPGILWYVLKL